MENKHSCTLYVYIERVIVNGISEDNEVKLRYRLGDNTDTIPFIKHSKNQYLFLKKLTIPLDIEVNPDSNEPVPYKFSIRLITGDPNGQDHAIAEFATGLTEAYHIEKMEISGYEMRAKMAEKPIITLAYAVLDSTSDPPSEFETFRVPKVHQSDSSTSIQTTSAKPSKTDSQESSKSTDNVKTDQHIFVDTNESPPLNKHPANHSESESQEESEKTTSDDEPIQKKPTRSKRQVRQKSSPKKSVQRSPKSNSSPPTEENPVQTDLGLRIISLEETVIHMFLNLNDFQFFEPGSILAQEIKKLGPAFDFSYASRIFGILNEIMKALQNEKSAMKFFASALALKEDLTDYQFPDSRASNFPKKLAYLTVNEVIKQTLKTFEPTFIRAIEMDPSSPEYKSQISKFQKAIERFSAPYAKYIIKCTMHALDVKITNQMITDGFLVSFDKIKTAQSSLTDLEIHCKVEFPYFKESLLTVLASEAILEDSTNASLIVPKINPTAIYRIYSHIQPDKSLPRAIPSDKLERFRSMMKINVNAQDSDILLKTEIIPFPQNITFGN